MLYVRMYTPRKAKHVRDNPIFSSEKMLHKNYYRKSSVEKKISGRGSQKGLMPRRTDWR
jgi:hypothetical protein